MENKERILKGAEELFFRYGLRSVTMDDIARHIGMSKKTIYQFFKDKNDIVVQLVEYSFEQDRLQMEAVSKNAAHVIEEMMGNMRCMSENMGKVNPVVFFDLQKYHANAWALFREFKEGYLFTWMYNALERGKAQGYIRTAVNSSILARMHMEQVEMAFNPDIFPGSKYNIVEVQMALLEHFIYGVCTVKGHKLLNKYREINEDE